MFRNLSPRWWNLRPAWVGGLVFGALLAAAAALVFVRPTQGTTVSGQVFLQGNYVEVGIHSGGFFGSTVAAPAGFHPIGRTALGFVADIGKDGWATGTPPQSGDYFLPGTPFELWGVEWNIGATQRTFSNSGGGAVQVPQTSLTESSTASSQSAVWVGEATSGSEKLKITQTTKVGANDTFFTIGVVLENTGSVTLESVEYLRAVDPDNDKDLTGGGSARLTTFSTSLAWEATLTRRWWWPRERYFPS